MKDDDVSELVKQQEKLTAAISEIIESEDYKCEVICSALAWVLADVAYENDVGPGRVIANFFKTYDEVAKLHSLRYATYVKEKYSESEIASLGLSVRATNVLKADGIFFVSDLLLREYYGLLKVPGLGVKTIAEIEEVLHKNGLAVLHDSRRVVVRG
jgi:hypothetical protein